MRFTIKFYKKGKKPWMYHTSKKTRLQGIVTANIFDRVYIKVLYGKQKCNLGCICEFYNDGYYDTKQEIRDIITYFTIPKEDFLLK